MTAVPAPRRPLTVAALPLLALVAAVLPVLALATLVTQNWVNVPVSDEWTTSLGFTLAKAREGTLSLPYLFSQHTESRPFFPRLIALALNAGGGEWDVRRGMVLNLALALGLSALLFWRVLDRERPVWSRLAVLAAMNVLLFSPVGWEIWLWGQGYIVLLTLFCLVGILAVNASGASLQVKAGLNAALAFVGTFSFSNGLLLWLLGWPVNGGTGRAEEDGRLPRALYAGAAVAALALFFVGFRPTDRAAVPFALGHPLAAARYLVTWCAVPFRPGGPPDAGHALLGAAVVGLFVTGAGRAWRTDRRTAWPWIMLGTFALASGALAALGRTRTGLEFALSSRYAVTAALLPVAALGAWWTAGTRNWRTELTAGAALALGAAGLLHARAFGGAVENMRGAREAREKAREALAFVDLMPGNPQLRPIFSDLAKDPGALRNAFHRLQAVGLVQTTPSSPALEDALGKAPPPTAPPGGGGSLDTCAPRGTEQIVVSGWASDPAAPGERPAIRVAFQWTPLDAAGNPAGPPRPWTTLRVDRERPDVASALGRAELARCGFSEAIYRPLDGDGAGRVSAWAIDPVTGRARRLDHTFDLPAVPAPPAEQR